MANFVWDDTGLNGPKSDLTPEPVGADPNKWVNAADWNQTRQAVLDIQTVARSQPGIFDIRNFGAQSINDYTDWTHSTFDNSPAIEAAIAAWTQQNAGYLFGATGPVGGVYIPPGNWYISRPVMLPAGCKLFGEGPELSSLVSGLGGVTYPALCKAFAGPMIYLNGKTTNANYFPQTTTPLVGVTGVAMKLATKNDATFTYYPTVLLDDSYPWGVYLYQYAAQLTLRCWAQVTSVPAAGGAWLIGCYNQRTNAPGCVALDVVANGSNIQYRATLTTAVTGQQQIYSSNFAANTTAHYLELSYNGAVFDFYVDGINQGNLAATGKVYREPFEVATLGDCFASPSGVIQFQPNGAIDSIEMSDIARHTGTSSYTPPTTKTVADSHTLWLANFDQPPAPTGWPFFMAQSAFLDIVSPAATYGSPPSPVTDASAQPSHEFPAPHYCRIGGYVNGYTGNVGGIHVEDLQLIPKYNQSGIILQNANRAVLRRINIYGGANYGLCVTSNDSFYCRAEYINALAYGTSIYFMGTSAKHCETNGGVAGFWGVFGEFDDIQDQPTWWNICSFIWGPSPDNFSTVNVRACGNDSEVWNFTYQMCSAYYFDCSDPLFQNNIWDAHSGNAGTPAFLCNSGRGGSKHIGDAFFTNFGNSPGISTDGKAPAQGAIDCDNCRFPFGPLVTDIAGFVTLRDAQRTSNQKSLGVNSTPGNNLAGEFTVLHGYTSGGATFLTPEPDANYILNIQFKYSEGSAPAAGSTTVTGYTTGTDGFVVTLGADPAGTCNLHFTWVLIRTPGGPLYRNYLPTTPSTLTSPFITASPTGDFMVGVTIVPSSGHCLKLNATLADQMAVTTGNGVNCWALKISDGILPYYEAMGLNVYNPIQTDYVSYLPYATRGSYVTDGRLYGLLNPGAHNVAFGITSSINGLSGRYAYVAYVDGGYSLATQFVPGGTPGHQPSHGTQQTPIYIGRDSGGTSTLSTIALRNLCIDTDPGKVITIEPDSGPQSGQTQAAFFGEDLIVGYSAGAAATGGYATQIANAKYTAPNTYYWFAARSTLRTGTMLSEFWLNWGQFKTFTAMVVQCGYWDLLSDGTSGANTWAPILSMLEGTPAAITWIPPDHNTFAWAGFVCPFRNQPGPHSGSANFSIIGQAFVSTWNTSDMQTLTDTYNLVILNATVTAAFNVSIDTHDPPNPFLRFDAKTPGWAGNNQVTTTDGANGAFWYPGPGTAGGANAQLTITPVGGVPKVFDVVFVTDANTTVNNTIAAMAADAPTNAVVTGTNVANQLVITANAAGSAGNGIAVRSDYGAIFSNAFIGYPPVTTLHNGSNGARTRVPVIVLCNCIPFGNAPGYTAGKNTERGNFNTLVAAYAAAHAADGVVLADCESTVWNPADHTKVAAANLASDNETLTDAGHTALYTLINPLLP